MDTATAQGLMMCCSSGVTVAALICSCVGQANNILKKDETGVGMRLSAVSE